jgi:NAD(P)-dependent dehydrogenase (short-subunit alcohol dehydrogenase family)
VTARIAATGGASRKGEACEETVRQLRATGGDALSVPCHLGDPDQVRSLVDRTVEHYGRIDCVVNNAATALRFGVADFDTRAWAKSLDVNARGPLQLVHCALPHLQRSPDATIINVLSVGGLRGSMSLLGYGSAKALMRHATESTAAELAPHGIRVNAIAPGPFATDMLTTTAGGFQSEAIERTLLKRMADPDEIVGAAIYLATRASSYVTGATLVVDGGLLA